MKELLQEFDDTNNELLQIVNSFESDLLNKVPYEGSWTPGQAAEHVYKSHIILLKSLNGPVKPTSRKESEYVKDIRDTFLDFTIKMESPAVIVPEKKKYDKQELLQKLAGAGAQIRWVIINEDLSATCLFVEVKELGEPTRLELAHFIIVHTKRHMHQLKKMRARLQRQ
jgi:hypothetical protein